MQQLSNPSDVKRKPVSLDKDDVFTKLKELQQLPHNWNGYGAAPINSEIINAVTDFVSSVPSDLVETPHVVPMTRGRLQLEWHKGKRSLELEFESPEQLHYLKWDPDRGVEEEDVLSIQKSDQILALLKWFAAE